VGEASVELNLVPAGVPHSWHDWGADPGTVMRRKADMNTTIKTVKACIAISLAIMLTACTTTLGRNFDEAYAQQIKSGETTKTEVLGKLGRPVLRKETSGEETWTYAYYHGGGYLNWVSWFTVPDEDLQYGLGNQKRLVVVFKGDVVKSSVYTQEIPQRQ
jgi:outer membrane protein assembly factor BamE (lipoprotein component of BamABCDE complex)